MIVLLVFAYVLIGIIVACRVTSYAAWRMHKVDIVRWSHRSDLKEPTGEQWFGGALFGIAAGAIWPATLIGSISRSILFAPPKEVREAQKDEYIKKLEKELSLND